MCLLSFGVASGAQRRVGGSGPYVVPVTLVGATLMSIELVAVVRRVLHVSNGSVVSLTSVDLVYPDGRDCGVTIFVKGYVAASELLMRFGVPSHELEERREKFEKDSEVCFPLIADEAVVRNMG